MKKAGLYRLLLVIAIFISPGIVKADSPDEQNTLIDNESPIESAGDPGGGPDAPIDAWLGVLLVAGAAYGVKKYKDGREENSFLVHST